MFPEPVELKVLDKYALWLKFSDDTEGKVDLSHLAGKGIFKQWENGNFFKGAYIDKETGAIAWSKEMDICPDALYLRIVNKTFEEWKKTQK